MDYTSHYNSPLGVITMASDGDALFGLWFDRQKYHAGTVASQFLNCDDIPVFEDTRRWLDIYFGGEIPNFTPTLLLSASGFRRRVWEIMLTIPYGQTMTYGDIAQIIAIERGMKKMSAQAVGGAVGHNNISLIIPCHRVIGSNGSLTGYGGGLDIKRRLLQLEKVL